LLYVPKIMEITEYHHHGTLVYIHHQNIFL